MSFIADTATVIHYLETQLAWVETLRGSPTTATALKRLRRLVNGCRLLLKQSAADYAAWWARKDRLVAIRKFLAGSGDPRGWRAVRDLVRLAGSDLSASRAFRRQVYVGAHFLERSALARQAECEFCGKLFPSRRKSARFCSAGCRKQHSRRRNVTLTLAQDSEHLERKLA